MKKWRVVFVGLRERDTLTVTGTRLDSDEEEYIIYVDATPVCMIPRSNVLYINLVSLDN